VIGKKFSVIFVSIVLFQSSGALAQERVKLRISSATKTFGYGPLWVASQKGFFERQGLDVELVVIRASDVGIQALAGGSLEIAGRSRVREWQIVTVACRCSSRSAIGFPTISLRPITTAR